MQKREYENDPEDMTADALLAWPGRRLRTDDAIVSVTDRFGGDENDWFCVDLGCKYGVIEGASTASLEDGLRDCYKPWRDECIKREVDDKRETPDSPECSCCGASLVTVCEACEE